MTTSRLHINPVSTAQDLAQLWSALVGDGPFTRRTLWLTLLDEDGRPAPVVVPIDDVPVIPVTDELDGLATVIHHLEGLGTIVMLLARPGGVAAQAGDRDWARALTPLAPRWPIHLASADSNGRCLIRPLTTW